MSDHNQITFKPSANRYEMSFDGQTIHADIRRDKDALYIDYVYAPPELRGKGAAGRFMTQLMDIVRAEKLKVVPICGYAASWFERHQEYRDIIFKR